jgi:anti-anti-sigma factor
MPSYQNLQGKIIVSFSGKMDTATCIDIEEELFKQIKAGPDFVLFDLKEVDYIASMFLRICTKVAQQTGKENFSIVNVTEPVMKVFKLTRINNFLNISEECRIK